MLGLLVGCGDIHTYSLNPNPVPVPDSESVLCLDGAEIELLRHSTRCENESAKSLVAEVGDGMEFSSDRVSTLEPPCAQSPSPGVEIHIEDTSLIFDFSNVGAPGRFPTADFEGYVFNISFHEDNVRLLAAAVDSKASTIDLENADLSFEFDRIEVNFESISYDDTGFIKIDLWFWPGGVP
jgi:hypothetical protein